MDKRQSPANLVRGSSAIAARARQIICINSKRSKTSLEQGDQVQELRTSVWGDGNNGPIDPFELRFLHTSGPEATTWLELIEQAGTKAIKSTKPKPVGGQVDAKILQLLRESEDALSRNAICKELGGTRNRVLERIAGLLESGQLVENEEGRVSIAGACKTK
jgi:hypothetical protein